MKKLIEIKYTSFLILIKDEEFFSKKLVSHINNQNVKAEFIIADGSKKKQKKIFDRLNQKKKYFYFGEDKNQKEFLIKILRGINKCTKKFIFFCDQDDLLNFRVIKEKEDFLIKNKDYSAVGGNVYSFVYIENKIKIIKDRYGFYYRYGVYNLDFKYFFFRYLLNIGFRSAHYLHRRKNLKRIWVIINKSKLEDMRSASLIQNLLTLNSGRIKYFDKLSLLRWSGIKKRELKKGSSHFLYQIFKNRYEWFKYFFSKKKNLIQDILKREKIFFGNFYFYKYFFFFFDISGWALNRINKYNFLFRVYKKIILKFYNNEAKIVKELKSGHIVAKEKIYL